MNRKGFTIVELMMVVGVIAILMTIVTTASMSAMSSSREKRRDVMRAALELAIDTMHAQDREGKWHPKIESFAEEEESGVLDEQSAQDVFRDIVKKSVKREGGVQLIDPTGLFVRPSGGGAAKSFADARSVNGRAGDGTSTGIRIGSMVFGYQGKNTGKFHPFNIVYDAQTDRVKVSTCCHDCLGVNGCRNSNCQTCHAPEK